MFVPGDASPRDWASVFEPFIRHPLVDASHWDRPTVTGWVGDRYIVWQVIGQRSGRCYGGTAADLRSWLNASEGERRAYLMSFLKKPVVATGGAAATAGVIDKKWGSDFPALFEYMTALAHPDGTARRTCSLSLFCEDGSVKGGLKDRDAGLVLWASAKTLQGLLGALEGLLTADETPWRVDRFSGAAEAKKGRSK